MSYERNLLPLDKATIRFSVTISTDDPQEALRQTVLDTNSKIQLLASPKPATLLDGAVDGGTSALDSVQSVVDDWSPLLEKLQIFCNIMDGVAEVYNMIKNDDRMFTYTFRFIHMRPWHGVSCQPHTR